MGNVRGASANWRQLNTTGRVDLLAGQRTQLQQYNRKERNQTQQQSHDPARLNESFASSNSGSETYGTRENYGTRETYGTARTSNAMEINKIAQCSKMVPGMSGSEIRSALTAVNWDTVGHMFIGLFFYVD